MSCYHIVVDSCGELPEEWIKNGIYEHVPLELEVEGYRIIDDDTFDQQDFLRRVKASPECPKSSCPSPERYMEAYDQGCERVYAVTLSSHLSGSYNSAVLAKNMFLEEHPSCKVHVFDSKSASVGQTLIAKKIQECEELGMDFAQVVEQVDAYIAQQNTYFVLETLETLRKNGRLSNLKAFVAGALNIKPVMGSTEEGTICQLDQARGMTKAVDKMIQNMLSRTPNPQERTLAISHCNCPERAWKIKEQLEKLGKFKEVMVLRTAGISSMYANDGGIIMAV